MTRTRSAGAVFTLLCLSACGGSPTPGPATSRSSATASPLGVVIPPARGFGDACRLLTPAEVQASIGGGPLIATSQTNPQSGSFCSYGEAGRAPIITVQAKIDASAQAADTGIDQIGGEIVSGVGDHARISTPQGLVTQIYFARGATAVSIVDYGRHPQQAVISLATTVAGRL